MEVASGIHASTSIHTHTCGGHGHSTYTYIHTQHMYTHNTCTHKTTIVHVQQGLMTNTISLTMITQQHAYDSGRLQCSYAHDGVCL